MNSRERVMAAINHKTPDRTPIFEYVLLPPVAEVLLDRRYFEYTCGNLTPWLTYVREAGWAKTVRQYAANRVELACRLGHDMLFVSPCPDPDFNIAERNGIKTDGGEEPDPIENIIRRNEQLEQSPGFFDDDAFFVYACVCDEMKRREVDLPIIAPTCYHGVY